MYAIFHVNYIHKTSPTIAHPKIIQHQIHDLLWFLSTYSIINKIEKGLVKLEFKLIAKFMF